MIGHFKKKMKISIQFQMKQMKTKKFQKNMKKFGRVLKKKLKLLMVAKKLNMGKILKKIKFKSDDDLPLNKPIKLCLLTIIIRSIFSENGKFYPELFLDQALYELV